MPGAHRTRGRVECAAFQRRCPLRDGGLATAIVVTRLRALSRSLAQDAPSQAALRGAGQSRRARAPDASGRRTAAGNRRSELPAVDGRARMPASCVRVVGGAAWRLAGASRRLAVHALRAENAGWPQARLPALAAPLEWIPKWWNQITSS